MRVLTPAAEITAMRELLSAEARPASVSRPWLMVNMVTALDGSVTRRGHAKELSGAADQAHFRALRELADVILVGANTVRVENYGPPAMPPEATGARIARGQKPEPKIVAVTHHPGSSDLRFETISLAEDAAQRIAGLAARFGPVILSEGGPHLLRTLVQNGLIDEWLITITPQVAGGEMRGIVAEPFEAEALVLDRLAVVDGFILARYLRAPAKS